MSKHKIIVPIRGMHCRSCEMLIEKKLGEIPEVERTNSNWKKGEVEIFYSSQRPNNHEIEEAIRSAGYSIGRSDKKYLVSSNPSDYKDLGVAMLFILGFWLILKNFGLTNINFGSGGGENGLSVVFLVGITAGLSTCMVLVGGLVLGLSTRHAEKHPEATTAEKFRPHLFFNLGRIIFFLIFGGILGSFGSVFQLSGLILGILTLLVGVVMLVMGLQLIEIFPILNGLKLTLPKSLAKIFGVQNDQKEYSHKGSMMLGALTFFLPCGFTQAMQLYAVSTGSFVSGSLIMATFALGTTPGLLGIGGITSVVKGIFAKRFFKFAGLLVIIFSFFNISAGATLAGWKTKNISQNSGEASEVCDAESGEQEVCTGENKSETKTENVFDSSAQVIQTTYDRTKGLQPNVLSAKINVPVKIIVDVKETEYGCMSTIMIPGLHNKYEFLKKGAKIELSFTPTKKGEYQITCAMGVPHGSIKIN